MHFPSRLRIDGEALLSNWRWLARMSGSAACGAAVKADGYGLGAREVVKRLGDGGCRDFFVATWAEAQAVEPLIGDTSLSVFHGPFEEDMPAAATSLAKPVLNTPAQVQRWREQGQGRACDIMIDTGMNRLGLSPGDVGTGVLAGLNIDIAMSHLACADADVPMNDRQLRAFAAAAGKAGAKRLSLANSAGICLGGEYAFDLTRPGLALYGGVPRAEAEGNIRQVVRVEARVIQRRRVQPGESVGYASAYRAVRQTEVAILHIGYADGYLRAFSDKGRALIGGIAVPVIGRVSMDLIAVAVDGAPHVGEGDWVEIDFDLPQASEQTGLSQYELLTTLGSRYERVWS